MNDEKFFEELAGGKSAADEEYKVELTKAVTVPTPTPLKKTQREAKIAGTETPESESEGQLTIDVYQTPSEIVVESAIAGVNPDDIDIDATNDSVTIKGSRHKDKEVNDDDYFYRECYWGRFSRSVILPQEVDPENAAVNFKNGILTVRLPKLNKQRSKKLKVKVE